jgi:hypothetical protein
MRMTLEERDGDAKEDGGTAEEIRGNAEEEVHR